MVIAGPSASGKSAVRMALAPMIDAISLGPDDFDGDWNALLVRHRSVRRSVIECVRIHLDLYERIIAAPSDYFIVALDAKLEIRRARLEARGMASDLIDEWMGQGWNLAWGKWMRADLRLLSDIATPEDLAGNIAMRVGKP